MNTHRLDELIAKVNASESLSVQDEIDIVEALIDTRDRMLADEAKWQKGGGK